MPMMQRNDMAALVAGMSVGVAGGALGALLACIVGVEAICRLMDRFADQGIELRRPAVPTARSSDSQRRLGDTPASPPATALPPVKGTATSTYQTANTPVAVPQIWR